MVFREIAFKRFFFYQYLDNGHPHFLGSKSSFLLDSNRKELHTSNYSWSRMPHWRFEGEFLTWWLWSRIKRVWRSNGDIDFSAQLLNTHPSDTYQNHTDGQNLHINYTSNFMHDIMHFNLLTFWYLSTWTYP